MAIDDLNIKQESLVQPNLKYRLITNIEISNFIRMDEYEFNRFIEEVEEEPIFKKLSNPQDRSVKSIKIARFPGTDIHRSFYGLKEEISSDHSLPDVEKLLQGREKVVDLIKEIGLNNFKKYFLYNHLEISQDDIGKETGLTDEKICELNQFLNYFSIHCDFFHPSCKNIPERRYHRICSICKNNGDFTIEYFSPNLCRGKYIIDYDKISNLKRSRIFSHEEILKTNKLLKNLELINNKKTTIYQILAHIISIQRNYLRSGNCRDLIPHTQKEAASEINIDPSLICRAIREKTVLTPWDEEKEFKFFFPSRKEIRKDVIWEIIDGEDKPLSDEKIKDTLRNKYGVNISRRSITNCRKELNISRASKRKEKQD